jgi:hypothetical protein
MHINRGGRGGGGGEGRMEEGEVRGEGEEKVRGEGEEGIGRREEG